MIYRNLLKNRYSDKKIFIQLYIINLCILLCAYSPMLFQHFSIDSYSLYFEIDGYAALVAGRLIFYLFFVLCNIFNFNPVLNQLVLILALLIVSAYILSVLVSYFYNSLYNKSKISFLMLELAFLIGFLNVFYLEWFLWPETNLIYALSLLFLLSAVNNSMSSDFSSIVFAIFALFLALNCYQAIFAMYFMILVLDCCIKNNFKFSIHITKEIIKYLIIAGVAAIFQILELKIIHVVGFSRTDFLDVNGIEVVFTNILEMVLQQKDLWISAYHFLPDSICLIFGAIVIFYVAIGMKQQRLKLIDRIFIWLMIFGCYLSIFVLKIFNTPVWLAPRIIIGFFFFFSMLIVMGLFLNEKHKNSKPLICIVLGTFLLINYIQIQDITRNYYGMLACNRYEAMQIEQYISSYENRNKTEVTKIAMRKDSNPTWGYQGIDYQQFETNERAFVVDWANIQCLNYYAGKSYKKVNFPDEIYEQFGKECDWNQLNLEEQMIFVNDIAYLVIY